MACNDSIREQNEGDTGGGHFDIRLPLVVIYGLGGLYAVSSVVCFGANTLLILLICLKQSLKRASNYLLLSIAAGDLLLLGICVPFTVLSNLIWLHWTFGPTLCSFVSFIQTAVVIQRSLLLSASAIQQHRAFRSPFGKRMSSKITWLVIAIVWASALILSTPLAVFSQIEPVNREANLSDSLCLEVWENSTHRLVYSSILMVVTYIYPVTVLLVTKIDITLILFSRTPPIEGQIHALLKRREQRRKTLADFLTVVAAYALCWMPIHIITIIGEVSPSIYDNTTVHVLWLFSHWLAMCNSAVNPMLVLLKQDKFREQMFNLIRSSFWKQRSTSLTSAAAQNSLYHERRRSTRTSWL